MVHVVQAVLEEHRLLRAAQGLDHLGLVPLHAAVDVVVGIDLSLDVLKTDETPFFKRYYFTNPKWEIGEFLGGQHSVKVDGILRRDV